MMDYILSTGHTKIAFLCGPDRYKYARQRKAGYIQTLKDAGLPVNKDWIIQLPELDFDMALSSIHQLYLRSPMYLQRLPYGAAAWRASPCPRISL